MFLMYILYINKSVTSLNYKICMFNEKAITIRKQRRQIVLFLWIRLRIIVYVSETHCLSCYCKQSLVILPDCKPSGYPLIYFDSKLVDCFSHVNRFSSLSKNNICQLWSFRIISLNKEERLLRQKNSQRM